MPRRSRPPRESRSIETTGRTIDEAVAKASAKLKTSEHDLDIQVLEEGRGGFLGIGSKEARVRATVKGSGGADRSPRSRDDGPRERRSDGPPRGRRQDRSEDRNDNGDRDRDDQRRRRSRGRGRGRGDDATGFSESRPSRDRRPAPDRGSERSRERSFGGGRGSRDAAVATAPAPPDADFEARAKELLSGILDRMGFSPEVESHYDDGAYLLTVQGGDDEAILIGRKGETLDALQHLVYKSISRGREDSLTVRIDVAGYREKREGALADQAKELANEVLSSGRSQQTEPLRPAERRIVHRAIAEIEGVASRAIGNGVVKKVLIEVEGAKSEAPAHTESTSPPARRPEPAARVSGSQVLDYVSQPVLAETNRNEGSASGEAEWGRRARPSKKVRRR